MDILDRITVNPRLKATLTQQLAPQFTWLIASGQLRPGDRLPSVRQLAERLSISVNTVRGVYQKLEADGLAETRHGAGTHVLAVDARRLAQIAAAERSHTVGVILPSLANPFYHALLQGLEEVAHPDRTMLFVSSTHDDPSEAWRHFAQLSAKQVDGIIVVSHDTSGFLAPSTTISDGGSPLLPVITVDWPEAAGYAVMMDLVGAGFQATRHLLEHGSRRVGLITFDPDGANVKPINVGYHRALTEAGIEADPALIVSVPAFDMAAGAEGARQLLALAQPPTAIFAIGGYACARRDVRDQGGGTAHPAGHRPGWLQRHPDRGAGRSATHHGGSTCARDGARCHEDATRSHRQQETVPTTGCPTDFPGRPAELRHT